MEAWIPSLLTLAVLAPLIAFFAILATGRALPRGGRPAFWITLAAIATSLALSTVAATLWHATTNGSLASTLHAHEPTPEGAEEASPLGAVPAADALAEEVPRQAPRTLTGRLLFVARFDALSIELTYLVDGLTILFFPLICGVATCVIVYAGAYMDDETRIVVDPHAAGEDDGPVRRPGRYARFFQFLAFFCFSMLGLVLAGDLLSVFVFWELVGAASYFLIGFYVERESANAAANKAFFVNRISDFGMLSGIAMFLGAFGTLAIADRTSGPADGPFARGLTTQVAQRLLPGAEPTREIHAPPRSTSDADVAMKAASDRIWPFENWRIYLTVAGVLLFCGCVGKSAQVPLHVWLPDAMEGPTPVSALVHSATMVAAGVYLLGRVYPLLLPETLAVVAIVGMVTALAGAAMAAVASDLKKALAFSTMSQLGLMTLSMGVGGWFAGLFHLATHAFFKCLLFLGAGAVQHGVGTFDLDRLGGLGRKMPLTAGLMLVGAVALAGLGLPLIVLPGLGLAGFHSKDAILEQIFVFAQEQPWGWSLFGLAALVGAMTAYYIGRIWLLIFRDRPSHSESSGQAERHEDHDASHVHDPSWTMALPMGVLAFLAIVAGWAGWQSAVAATLFAAGAIVIFLRSRSTDSAWTKPALFAAGAFAAWAALGTVRALWFPEISLQATLQSAMPVDLATAGTHEEGALLARAVAGLVALGAALTGLAIAWRRFGSASRPPLSEPALVRPVRTLLVRRFYVDEFYRSTFVEGYFAMTKTAAAFDRWIFDRAVDGIADGGRQVARLWTKWVDQRLVDGGFDGFGLALVRAGMRLRLLQSGNLRQYVFFLAAAAIGLFVIVFFFLDAEAALERLRAATKSR